MLGRLRAAGFDTNLLDQHTPYSQRSAGTWSR
jgi:hypothetical protein